MLRRRLGALVLAVTALATPHIGRAGLTFEATCTINLQATFNPPLTTTATVTRLDFATLSSTCVGTDILSPAYIAGTATASMSCTDIHVLAGVGTMTYGAATPGGFDFLLLGNAVAMEMVLTPGTSTILGSATLIPEPIVATGCTNGVGSARLVGSFTFVDP